ncbi:hypothetical protein [Ferruginibacter sp. SUN106]|uniref:hypothetical protein n=1 Tax=Ferruginibacter sp. SUN106 TaxID=2978348 RepID=UPI003D3641FD
MLTTSIKKVTGNHDEWTNSLGFYKDELMIYKKRLLEVVSKNTNKEIMQMVEHFQNQFLVQSENIDILRHDINKHMKRMAAEIQLHAGHVDREELPIHFLLKDRFETEQKVFTHLKEEFQQFLVKVM